ncbi:nuclear transport factor 2 family protein [Avibacterium sp. 20-15]|uniref:nuclear transport factor 2 family protein n=1 Tax=unclassified Avibacterium TaxID=2685287 RepID=UPI002025C286|nr:MULTISPECIES: nuclear transport factor 2 family protein [unclassified Avibacterium]MCW9731985.1 nuclear transport factor 2 family protein [Avibacterium sp. 20-15]URL04169.1 nuclear transport factor 2 family protein [Avibacterium sp. 20-132]
MNNMAMTEQSLIEQVFDDYMQAVIKVDIDTLYRLTESDFTLTHVTGTVQSLADYVQFIQEGTFHYYSYHKQLSEITVDGQHAKMYVRGKTDASIYGIRKVWKIGQTLSLIHNGQAWKISKIVV